MAQIKPTRMELLKTKKRIKLAVKGHKLLKQKRDVLVMEFFGILKEIKEIRIKMGAKLGKARKSLYNAIALEGALDIERLSLGLAQEVKVEFITEKLMGVEIPKLKNMEISYQWPGYFDQSVELDNAIVKYRNLFPDLVKLAEKQLVMTKLAEEIKKTKRRVNSLEFLTIPRLTGIARFITFRLEELERENFARLKVIKGVQERKAEA
ncbi:MAG: V-type ATP synthase subunit D [Candidatus Kariarchaeaceae archaeon]